MAQLNPSPKASRDELAQLFSGLIDETKEPTNIESWRTGIRGFVQEHWHVLQPQLTCPIRHDINACSGCLDQQVVACVVEQKDCEPLIQLHRKKG